MPAKFSHISSFQPQSHADLDHVRATIQPHLVAQQQAAHDLGERLEKFGWIFFSVAFATSLMVSLPFFVAEVVLLDQSDDNVGTVTALAATSFTLNLIIIISVQVCRVYD